MAEPTRAELAQMIDHTLLKPEATPEDVHALIAEANDLGTYSVCVSPSMLSHLTMEGPLDLGDVKLAVVCGFPSGKHLRQVKAYEAAAAAERGAQEIDMVIDIGLAKTGRFELLTEEIVAVRQAAPDVVLKVIIESAALTDEEIVGACKAAMDAQADFVKTSTGFHPAGGASVHAVELMRRTVGDSMGVKASGGIRDWATAVAMVNAGANRLGLSSSRAVLDGSVADGDY